MNFLDIKNDYNHILYYILNSINININIKITFTQTLNCLQNFCLNAIDAGKVSGK